MKIVIATGIYPPDIGGPAQFARELEELWRREGHTVFLHYFGTLRRFPTGIRHLIYLFRLIPDIIRADLVFIPDTFSAAVPAVLASRIFGKKSIIRTGGDFLWEWYVERTNDLVLLSDFYKTRIQRLSLKERIVFLLTGWALRNTSAVIFSTAWQRDIFLLPYKINSRKTYIVENFYGSHLSALPYEIKNFIAGTRPLKWKNKERVKEAFEKARLAGAEVEYDSVTTPHEAFVEKIRRSYAVIIATMGDVSPNTILDSIRCDKPFIVTRETGLYERIKDIATFVDPESVDDIAEKIIWLSDEKNYSIQQEKIRNFQFRHSWEEIGKEIVGLYMKIK